MAAKWVAKPGIRGVGSRLLREGTRMLRPIDLGLLAIDSVMQRRSCTACTRDCPACTVRQNLDPVAPTPHFLALRARLAGMLQTAPCQTR
jgi:hypothetical protein